MPFKLKKIYRFLLILLTLICYLSVLVSPGIFWPAGFLALAIPLLLLFFLVMVLVKIRKTGALIFYLILFLSGFPFLRMAFQLNRSEEPKTGTFEVLSYNVRVFNSYAHLDKDRESSSEMVKWVVQNDAAIKCLQEFYNQDTSRVFNVRNKLAGAGWKYVNQRVRFTDRSGAEFGQAIFSKFPMLNSGEVTDEKGEFMNAIFSDILIGKDTLRIYSMHLQSMSIDEDNIVDAERLKNSYIDTGYRLKNGFIARSKQIKFLIRHILKSPHAVIVCGDMNELPFSYPYVKIKKVLNNAFEKKGRGFGFTYNGKLFFLRIDNQFFSNKIKIHTFETHRKAKQSDHFPISAIYSFK